MINVLKNSPLCPCKLDLHHFHNRSLYTISFIKPILNWADHWHFFRYWILTSNKNKYAHDGIKKEKSNLEKGNKKFQSNCPKSFGNYIARGVKEKYHFFDHERRVPPTDDPNDPVHQNVRQNCCSLFLCRKLHLHFILHDLLANNRVDPQTGYFWYLSCARVSQLSLQKRHPPLRTIFPQFFQSIGRILNEEKAEILSKDWFK